ncbi:MAG: hypothetical protein U5K74_05765 [Gemmatimonadaceae bacterium]|nr:hypothetical protein [Gemmatimonadaceae bacterium]
MTGYPGYTRTHGGDTALVARRLTRWTTRSSRCSVKTPWCGSAGCRRPPSWGRSDGNFNSPQAAAGAPASNRAGFTTLELLIAMSVTLVIVAIAAPLYSAQTRAVNNDGRPHRRHALGDVRRCDAMEQDMRNTGVGAYDGQPAPAACRHQRRVVQRQHGDRADK